MLVGGATTVLALFTVYELIAHSGVTLRAGRLMTAMADRTSLLERLCVALARPGADGVLGSADILEDLLLLGALDGKVVIGSMNRGGLADTVFEIDDRFTGYDAPAIARMGFDSGKMLLRIDRDDPATAATLQACAYAVSDLAARRLVAMIEPFISHRVEGGVRNDLSPEAMMRAIAVASGLGTTSAYTWLKVPVVPDMERVMAASTLPALLLGGEVPDDPESAYAGWRKALRLPNVKGLVAGRSLLYRPTTTWPPRSIPRSACCYAAGRSRLTRLVAAVGCSRVAGRRSR